MEYSNPGAPRAVRGGWAVQGSCMKHIAISQEDRLFTSSCKKKKLTALGVWDLLWVIGTPGYCARIFRGTIKVRKSEGSRWTAEKKTGADGGWVERVFSYINTLILSILFWPCFDPFHCSVSCLTEIYFCLFSWIRGYVLLLCACVCMEVSVPAGAERATCRKVSHIWDCTNWREWTCGWECLHTYHYRAPNWTGQQVKQRLGCHVLQQLTKLSYWRGPCCVYTERDLLLRDLPTDQPDRRTRWVH